MHEYLKNILSSSCQITQQAIDEVWKDIYQKIPDEVSKPTIGETIFTRGASSGNKKYVED